MRMRIAASHYLPFVFKYLHVINKWIAAKGVEIGIAFQKRLGAAFFGGEGFILQRLSGDGLVFVHAGGALLERDLQSGEVLKVDTGCMVAMEKSVDYDIEFVGGVKRNNFV